MSWRRTKGGQKRFTPKEQKAMAEQAAITSLRHAARKFRVSTTAVRRAMKIYGVAPRRQGNFTNAEAFNLKGWKP